MAERFEQMGKIEGLIVSWPALKPISQLERVEESLAPSRTQATAGGAYFSTSRAARKRLESHFGKMSNRVFQLFVPPLDSLRW